jgi:hypothetical protein
MGDEGRKIKQMVNMEFARSSLCTPPWGTEPLKCGLSEHELIWANTEKIAKFTDDQQEQHKKLVVTIRHRQHRAALKTIPNWKEFSAAQRKMQRKAKKAKRQKAAL